MSGYDKRWHVKWVEPDASEHEQVGDLVSAGMLVGSLMAKGIAVIAIRDHAWLIESQLDDAELASVSKSPYRHTQD